MFLRLFFFIATLALHVSGAIAGPMTDAFGQCLSDNTSGRDRKDLAKWIFVAMATHPEMQFIGKVEPAVIETNHRTMARLITRLLTDSCRVEARGAIKESGDNALEIAFEFLGKTAMQELMANPNVKATISGINRVIDGRTLDRTLRER